ncbi:O-antigen ligase like membrane protein [Cupriavidus necator]
MLQLYSIHRPWAEADHALLYFVLGAVAAIRVNLLGDVYIGEILGFAYAAYLLSSLKVNRKLAPILALTVMWCLAQGLSDIQNASGLTTSLKGVLAPLVFFATVYAIGSHFDRGHERRIWFFLIGTTLFQMTDTIFNPIEAAIDNPWKWGFATPVLTLLVAVLSLRQTGRTMTLCCLVAFAAVSVYFDFRSNAAMALLGALVFLARRSVFMRQLQRVAHAKGGMVLIFGVLAFAIYVLNAVFSVVFAHSAEFGFLSSDAAHKYTVQATSDLGILFGGRSEIVISFKAFLDAPLLGHGSWAVDRFGYVDEYNRLTQQLGMALHDNVPELDSMLIPTHSFMMGAMVWCGIAGGLFWLSLLGGCLRTFLFQVRHVPIYFCVAMPQFIWDVFFSPFGAANRWQAALFVGVLYAWSTLDRRRQGARAPVEGPTRPVRYKLARSV